MVSLLPTAERSFSSTVTPWSALASTSFKKETMSPLRQKTPIKDRPPLTSSVSDRLRPVDEHALRIPGGCRLLRATTPDSRRQNMTSSFKSSTRPEQACPRAGSIMYVSAVPTIFASATSGNRAKPSKIRRNLKASDTGLRYRSA